MSFPGTALPVRSQLFLGGDWVDFSDATLIRDPIRVTRGVREAGVRPDPARCDLSLRNPSGDLSPRLPTGPYYGLFGQNTPLRVVLDEASDDFNRTASNGWGTSSSGHSWATSGGLASAYAVSGGNATIAISAVNSTRITALNVSLFDCDMVVTFKPGVVATGAAIQMSGVLRYQDDSNLYMPTLLFNTDSTVQAAIVKRVGGNNTTLAITGTLGYYHASSQWRMRAKVCGRVLTIRAWDAVNGSEPTTFDTWAADNDADAILTAGKIGCRMLLQTGNTNTLPVTVTTSDLEVVHHRFNGEVPDWPLDWDLSGNDVWTPVEAAGILRRINKFADVFSPLRHALKTPFFLSNAVVTGVSQLLTARTPVGCWSFEEETGSTVASSILPGGQPMAVSGTVAWGSVGDVVGSAPLPDMMAGAATLVGSISSPETTTGAWMVGAVFTPPTLSATWTALSWKVFGNDTFDRFELQIRTDSTYDLYGFNGTSATLLGNGGFEDLATVPTWIVVKAQGFDADTEYRVDTTADLYDTTTSTIVHTETTNVPGYPAEVAVRSVAGGANDVASIGHVTVWDGVITLLDDGNLITALRGHAGEQGHLRLGRLFEQEDLPFICIGDESDAMGPQRTASLPDLIDDVLVVDKGLLYEARDENACVYLTRRARYNQPVTLALDYATPGQVAPPFRPTEPDRDAVNDLTVFRDGGAWGRYEQRVGRKSVLPSPQGSGRYPRRKTLPLYDDTQPYQHAAWEVNVATWDEARFATVNVNMARLAQDGATTVFEQAKRLDVGGRLTVANPPAWIPPDLIDLHAPGLTEQIGGGPRIGAHAWTISAQTVPAGPYSVGVLDTHKLDTAGCELMIARNTTDTSFTTHTTVLPRWVTGAGLSIPMLISGEKVTATTIANVSPSFVAAGTAAHGDNASLSPGLPAGLAPGDLLLLLAGISLAGPGLPLPPTPDWDVLADLGNLVLFGKYAASGESTPLVRFVAGVAGETTSAQTAAFRGVGLTIHKKAIQVNTSAQNIAYPALAVTRDNTLILYFGQKADDWTSVASPGTEIGEPDTTTGDDQGLVWAFTQQTTATPITAGSFTVTGGTPQASRSGVIALGSDVQTLTVTRSANTVAKSQSAREPIGLHPSAAFRPGL